MPPPRGCTLWRAAVAGAVAAGIAAVVLAFLMSMLSSRGRLGHDGHAAQGLASWASIGCGPTVIRLPPVLAGGGLVLLGFGLRVRSWEQQGPVRRITCWTVEHSAAISLVFAVAHPLVPGLATSPWAQCAAAMLLFGGVLQEVLAEVGGRSTALAWILQCAAALILVVAISEWLLPGFAHGRLGLLGSAMVAIEFVLSQLDWDEGKEGEITAKRAACWCFGQGGALLLLFALVEHFVPDMLFNAGILVVASMAGVLLCVPKFMLQTFAAMCAVAVGILSLRS